MKEQIRDTIKSADKTKYVFSEQLSAMIKTRGAGNTKEVASTTANIVVPTMKNVDYLVNTFDVSKDRILNMNYLTSDNSGKPFIYDNHSIEVLMKLGIESSNKTLKLIDEFQSVNYIQSLKIKELEQDLESTKSSNKVLSNKIHNVRLSLSNIKTGLFNFGIGRKINSIRIIINK